MCQYVMEVVRDAYDTMLMHLYSNTVKNFKTSLEQSQNVAAIHLMDDIKSCIRSITRINEGIQVVNILRMCSYTSSS
jgi:hypothetical protein